MTFESGASTRFLGAVAEVVSGAPAIFGAGYDGTASFRPGSRFGPDAIRAASDGLETYSPLLDRDLDDIIYADVGDVDVSVGAPEPALEAVYSATRALLERSARPVMLGGEHSLTAAAVRAVAEKHPGLTVLQLDAHADLRDEYLGEANSHACAMRRSLDHGVELIQVGIRSGTREEFSWMRAHDTWLPPEALAERLTRVTGPIYLTVDIDVFDPSVVPGTGTPEPGGIDWRTFEKFVTTLAASRVEVVAFDVMELAPRLDPSDVSSVVAAKVVRELLLVV